MQTAMCTGSSTTMKFTFRARTVRQRCVASPISTHSEEKVNSLGYLAESELRATVETLHALRSAQQSLLSIGQTKSGQGYSP